MDGGWDPERTDRSGQRRSQYPHHRCSAGGLRVRIHGLPIIGARSVAPAKRLLRVC